MSVPAAYIAVVLIWSTTPLAIQWSGVNGAFLFGVASRMVIGLLISLVIMHVWKIKLPRHMDAIIGYLVAGLSLYFAMVFVYWGAMHIPSGLVAVLFGLTPITTGILGVFVLNDRTLNVQKMIGIVVGLLGLYLIYLAKDGRGEFAIPGLISVLCAMAVYSTSMILLKKLDIHMHPIALNTGSLLIAVPLFVMTWLFFGNGIPLTIDPQQIGAIVYLGVFGTALGFVLYYYLLRQVSAVVVSLITLITPMVALWIGYQFNHEQVSELSIIGSITIVCGLFFFIWNNKLRDKLLGLFS